MKARVCSPGLAPRAPAMALILVLLALLYPRSYAAAEPYITAAPTTETPTLHDSPHLAPSMTTGSRVTLRYLWLPRTENVTKQSVVIDNVTMTCTVFPNPASDSTKNSTSVRFHNTTGTPNTQTPLPNTTSQTLNNTALNSTVVDTATTVKPPLVAGEVNGSWPIQPNLNTSWDPISTDNRTEDDTYTDNSAILWECSPDFSSVTSATNPSSGTLATSSGLPHFETDLDLGVATSTAAHPGVEVSVVASLSVLPNTALRALTSELPPSSLSVSDSVTVVLKSTLLSVETLPSSETLLYSSRSSARTSSMPHTVVDPAPPSVTISPPDVSSGIVVEPAPPSVTILPPGVSSDVTVSPSVTVMSVSVQSSVNVVSPILDKENTPMPLTENSNSDIPLSVTETVVQPELLLSTSAQNVASLLSSDPVQLSTRSTEPIVVSSISTEPIMLSTVSGTQPIIMLSTASSTERIVSSSIITDPTVSSYVSSERIVSPSLSTEPTVSLSVSTEHTVLSTVSTEFVTSVSSVSLPPVADDFGGSPTITGSADQHWSESEAMTKTTPSIVSGLYVTAGDSATSLGTTPAGSNQAFQSPTIAQSSILSQSLGATSAAPPGGSESSHSLGKQSYNVGSLHHSSSVELEPSQTGEYSPTLSSAVSMEIEVTESIGWTLESSVEDDLDVTSTPWLTGSPIMESHLTSEQSPTSSPDQYILQTPSEVPDLEQTEILELKESEFFIPGSSIQVEISPTTVYLFSESSESRIDFVEPSMIVGRPSAAFNALASAKLESEFATPSPSAVPMPFVSLVSSLSDTSHFSEQTSRSTNEILSASVTSALESSTVVAPASSVAMGTQSSAVNNFPSPALQPSSSIMHSIQTDTVTMETDTVTMETTQVLPSSSVIIDGVENLSTSEIKISPTFSDSRTASILLSPSLGNRVSPSFSSPASAVFVTPLTDSTHFETNAESTGFTSSVLPSMSDSPSSANSPAISLAITTVTMVTDNSVQSGTLLPLLAAGDINSVEAGTTLLPPTGEVMTTLRTTPNVVSTSATQRIDPPTGAVATSPLTTEFEVVTPPSTVSSNVGTTVTNTPITTAEDSLTTQPKTTSSTRQTTTSSSRTTQQTIPPTVPPTLNTSDVFKNYWVKTVVKVPGNIDISDPDWQREKEFQLSTLYSEGLATLDRQSNQSTSGRRVRRASTVDDTTLQMVNVTRESPKSEVVDMIYYMESNGTIVPALTAVAAMFTFDVHVIVLKLELVVISRAEVYAPPYVPPPYDPKLWLIGAVVGGIVGFSLLIWCVLFTYFKCTRPSKARPRTPRTPRSTRISMAGEYDTNSYRNKMPKIQSDLPIAPLIQGSKAKNDVGFDIARTEVGLENEIQKDLKRKPPEPYRRRPDGSTELEGMYSPGETPPPKQPLRGNTPPEKVREDGEGEEGLVAPHSGQKVKGQRQTEGGGRPLPPALETLHPPKKLPKKRAESEESLSPDDGSGEHRPLSPDRREKRDKKVKKKGARSSRSDDRPKSKSRKKKRYSDDENEEEVQLDSSQAGLYENVSKMSRGENQRPEVKLRATSHAIKLPPLIMQPLVGDALTNSQREETELQESLQQKADIERWRNKQRQRERTKGSKNPRAHRVGDRRQIRRAYRKAQKEIENVLGYAGTSDQVPNVFQKPRRKKPHKRSGSHPVAEAIPESMELNEMFGPTDAQYNHLGSVNKQTSTEESGTTSSSDETSSELRTVSPEPTLEEARQRMHALLDDTFSLIAPFYRRHNKVVPSRALPPKGPVLPPAHGKARARARRDINNASGASAPPTGNRSREFVWKPSDMEDTGPRHTPMYVTPVTKRTGADGDITWSPYTAADEVAKIPTPTNTMDPGGDHTKADVGGRDSESSTERSAKPVRPVSAFNYTNPAYLHDVQAHGIQLGSHQLPNTRFEGPRTNAEPDTEVVTPRSYREALPLDSYTSIAMDSSILNPGVDHSHATPERDSGIVSATTLEASGSRGKRPKSGGRRSKSGSRQIQPMPDGVATVHPLSSQSMTGSQLDSQLGSGLTNSNQSQYPVLQSVSQSDARNQLHPDWINEDDGFRRPQPADDLRKGYLDPEIPEPSCIDGEDEIDVIERAVKPGGRNKDRMVRSLREELERLANRSSAEMTVIPV